MTDSPAYRLPPLMDADALPREPGDTALNRADLNWRSFLPYAVRPEEALLLGIVGMTDTDNAARLVRAQEFFNAQSSAEGAAYAAAGMYEPYVPMPFGLQELITHKGDPVAALHDPATQNTIMQTLGYNEEIYLNDEDGERWERTGPPETAVEKAQLGEYVARIELALAGGSASAPPNGMYDTELLTRAFAEALVEERRNYIAAFAPEPTGQADPFLAEAEGRLAVAEARLAELATPLAETTSQDAAALARAADEELAGEDAALDAAVASDVYRTSSYVGVTRGSEAPTPPRLVSAEGQPSAVASVFADPAMIARLKNAAAPAPYGRDDDGPAPTRSRQF